MRGFNALIPMTHGTCPHGLSLSHLFIIIWWFVQPVENSILGICAISNDTITPPSICAVSNGTISPYFVMSVSAINAIYSFELISVLQEVAVISIINICIHIHIAFAKLQIIVHIRPHTSNTFQPYFACKDTLFFLLVYKNPKCYISLDRKRG